MGVKLAIMKKMRFHLLVIAIVGLIAYSNSFSVPFQFDDLRIILDGPYIQNLDNFSLSHMNEYNPRRYIGYLSLALNYHFGGLDVTGYHIVNLLIHLINAILVYFFVVFTFRTPYFSVSGTSDQGPGISNQGRPVPSPQSRVPNFFALFSALLFVAHPVQTQAVTYIVQRLTSLTTLFYLLSIVLYSKGRLITQQSAISDQQTIHHSPFTIHHSRWVTSGICYLLSIVSTVCAMKTKEIAFTLPIMILLYEFTFFRSSLKRKLLFLIPVLLTLVIIPISMLHIDRPLGEVLSDLSEKSRLQTDMSRGDYLMTEMRVIVTYIRLIVLPINQNLDYDYPIYRSFFTVPVFLSFLFLSALFGTAVYLMYKSGRGAISYQQSALSNQRLEEDSQQYAVRSNGSTTRQLDNSTFHHSLFTIHLSRLIAFGILWFFLALSVESSFIPIVDVIFEHRIYLPSVGAFIALTAALFAAAGKMEKRWRWAEKALLSLLLIIVVLLSGTTFARNRVWQDAITLWENNVRNQPASFRAHYNLGTLYEKNGRLEEAMRELQSAITRKPDSAEAHINLGMVYGKQGRLEKAIGELQTAINLKPNSVEAHQNLQKVYADLGRFEDAASELKYVFAINHYEQSVVYNQQGRLEEALRELTAAVAVKPEYAEAYNGLGVLYDKQGRLEEAVRELQTALRVKPDYAEAHNNLGIIYAKQGYLREAERHLQAAVAIKPDYSEANKNLQRILKLKENRTVERPANQP